MRIRSFLIFLPTLLILTGCSTASNSDQVAVDLIRACELVNARDPNKDLFIPDVGIQFFASAARANPDYIPLVQAAALAQLQPLDFAERANATTSDVIRARTMIVGYCTPRVAE